MNLQDGDYIVSAHPFEETWELVVGAIRKSSVEQFQWNITEDRFGQRVTATMEYRKLARLKRRLILEVNLFSVDDNRVRLELHYTITPMFNVKQPSEIIDNTVAAIANAVNPTAEVYGINNADLPEVLVDAGKSADRGSGVMRGLEILLAINVVLLLLGAISGPLGNMIKILLNLEVGLAIPGAFILAVWQNFSTPMKGGRKWSERPTSEQLMIGLVTVLGGVLFCIIAVPLMLFGLCMGILYLGSHH